MTCQKITPIGAFLATVLLAIFPSPLRADDQNPKISKNPAGYSLDWSGDPGRTYFVQMTTNLQQWHYFPEIYSGDGSLLSHGFNSNAPRLFTRLIWTDLPDGGDPSDADFDNDGLATQEELTSAERTDPLNPDTDGDGLRDGWERTHGFNPVSTDSDGNGTPDGAEDPDGDGANNETEQNNDSDPNNGSDSGPVEFFPSIPFTDLDIVHPTTGELDEDGENQGRGYVFVKKLIDEGNDDERDVAPITRLKIQRLSDARNHWKLRLKFDTGGRYKIYQDEDRTQLVTSEATEFPANKETILYLQGEKESSSLGEEQVALQINFSDVFYPGDLVKFTVLSVDLEKISFDGTEYYELKKDDLTETYSAPHWIKADGTNESVAFKRNSKPKVEAFFKLDVPNDLLAKIKIKGVASDGVEFPEQALVKDGGSVKYPMKEASSAFPNTIKFYDRDDDTKAFKIDWQISVGGGAFTSIGESKHQVYLTLESAVASPAGDNQETLFYLGSKNADRKSDANSAVASIYADFKDQDVRRIESNASMTYYKNTNDPYSTCNGLTDLLKTNDGRCGSFQELMNEILYAQGINNAQKTVFSPNRYINAAAQDYVATFGQPSQPLQGARDVFFVKNWNVDLNNRFASQDLNGLTGQGNPNPLSIFGDHALIEYGGKIYDPSYGSGPFNNLTDWEDASVDAHGAQFIINGSPLNHVLWAGNKDQKGMKELNSN